MRNYEAMFIFKSDLDEEKLDKEIKSIEKAIKTRGKGEVKFETLGKKMFAYPVKKSSEGIYVNYMFTALPESISKIKEALKHRESILRFVVFLGGTQT